jgi:hypothetical protein
MEFLKEDEDMAVVLCGEGVIVGMIFVLCDSVIEITGDACIEYESWVLFIRVNAIVNDIVNGFVMTVGGDVDERFVHE